METGLPQRRQGRRNESHSYARRDARPKAQVQDQPDPAAQRGGVPKAEQAVRSFSAIAAKRLLVQTRFDRPLPALGVSASDSIYFRSSPPKSDDVQAWGSRGLRTLCTPKNALKGARKRPPQDHLPLPLLTASLNHFCLGMVVKILG
jgi:hypothetical protein